MGAGQEPTCAQACPTDWIQFGDLHELQVRPQERVAQLHEQGVSQARLYGEDPADGKGGAGAFFLLTRPSCSRTQPLQLA